MSGTDLKLPEYISLDETPQRRVEILKQRLVNATIAWVASLSRSTVSQELESTLEDAVKYVEKDHQIHSLALFEDVDEKLEILRYFQKVTFQSDAIVTANLKPKLCTPLLWAAMIVAPITSLRRIQGHMLARRAYPLDLIAEALVDELFDMIEIFLARPPEAKKEKYRVQSSTACPRSDANRPNKTQQDLAFERDQGTCLITGCTDPHVCYIFPLSGREHLKKLGVVLESLARLWGHDLVQTYTVQLGHDNIDTASNMLSLSYQAHNYWGRAIMGLEPLEQTSDTSIRVRVRWMMASPVVKGNARERRIHRYSGGFDLATDPRDYLKPLSIIQGSYPSQFTLTNVNSLHRVRDGYEFDIKANTPEELPSLDLLDLQYRVMQMAALVGAGEDEEDEENEMPEPNADTAAQAPPASHLQDGLSDSDWDE